MQETGNYDRGRAWLVLVSCFVNYGVGVGMYPGVYVAAIIDHFGCTRANGYFIGVLGSALFFLSGPIASASADKTSYRITAVSGGLLATAGLVLSANGTTLTHQYVAFSITGIGCGFLHQSAVAVVSLFFRKYLKLATSITVSGGGVSLMAYPIVCQHVIKTYAWQPSFYIIAGICLNTCVTSMFIVKRIYPKREAQNDSLFDSNDEENDALDTAIVRQPLSDEDTSNEEYNHEVKVTDISSIKRVETAIVHIDYRDDVDDKISDDDAFSVGKEDIDKLWKETEDRSAEYIQVKRGCELASDEIKIIDSQNQIPLQSEGIFKKRAFWLFLCNTFLLGPSIASLTILLPDMYNKVNVTESKQSLLFAIWGATSIIGRILSGSLWPRLFSPVICYTVTSFLWTSAILLFTGREHFAVLAFANGIVSLMFGSAVACLPIYIKAIVGVRNISRTFAYCNLVCGIGSLLSPFIGYIYDATLDYTWPVVVAAILGLMSSAALLPTAFALRKARIIHHE